MVSAINGDRRYYWSIKYCVDKGIIEIEISSDGQAACKEFAYPRGRIILIGYVPYILTILYVYGIADIAN